MKHDNTWFAQEITQLETILAEKTAMLENMTLPNTDDNTFDGVRDNGVPY